MQHVQLVVSTLLAL